MKNNEDYSAYVGIGHNQQDQLLEVTRLAEAAFEAKKKLEQVEEQLKVAKEEYKQVAEKQLPELMDALGLKTFKTSSGISVEVAEKIRTSLPPENRIKAFNWLEENGYGGMIKSTVVVAFKREEIEKAKELANELRIDQYIANVERKIEPMTLTSFIKEQLTQGKDIPLDIFGVYRQRIADVEI